MDVKQVYNDLVSMNIGKVIENEPMYKHTPIKWVDLPRYSLKQTISIHLFRL